METKDIIYTECGGAQVWTLNNSITAPRQTDEKRSAMILNVSCSSSFASIIGARRENSEKRL